MPSRYWLSSEEKEALRSIATDPAVYELVTAMILRRVRKKYPDLLDILSVSELERLPGKASEGTQRLAYFGGILTAKGREATGLTQ